MGSITPAQLQGSGFDPELGLLSLCVNHIFVLCLHSFFPPGSLVSFQYPKHAGMKTDSAKLLLDVNEYVNGAL